jgi:diguanylate cyclase (GGDEF)-like protein
MKLWIEGGFLRSKVARRVFFLFVLSAFVPTALLTALSYEQMRSMDKEYVQRRLAQEGDNYAKGLYERLLGAHFMLGVQAAGLRQGIRVNAAHLNEGRLNEAEKVFRRVYLINGRAASLQAGPPSEDPIPRITPQVQAHLARNESALLSQDGLQTNRILLATAVNPEQLGRGVIVGELEPAFLWGQAEEFSERTQTCAMDATRQVLFCSDENRRPMVASLVRPRDIARAGQTENWQFETRDLFLRARFDADDWTVVTLSLKGAGTAAWVQLAYTFLAVIVLTLLMVALLSLVQIRRTLVPLEHLIEGTRRIKWEIFDEPVPVEGDDEFGQLAASFNSMANRLGNQLRTMHALAEVDREILTRVDMNEIIKRVQESLQTLWPNSVTGVVVSDQNTADFGIVHLYGGKNGITAKLPTKLEPWLLNRLARDYDGAWFDVGGSDLPDFLSMVSDSGAKRILMLPIIWRESVKGMLVIGLLERHEYETELISQARDLGNRIGVALAAQAREDELKYRAYHDDLTGLPNRALMVERLNQELAHARRNRTQLALIFIDLDRFKSINDSKGHESGDKLLCEVADRLTSCTREGDTVARLGGDEFVVLLPGLDNPQQAARLADEMLKLLVEPFMIKGSESFVGASIGVSLFPVDGTMASELIKKADMAMYRAKATGGGRIVFFEESMNVVQLEHALLEQELRLALARRQFSIHYQPRVRLADGHLSGAEALLRWHHPDLGWVAPERFMLVAVEVGLIDEIGQWVLRQVCEQLAQWRIADIAVVAISVKVSGPQFKSGKLIHQVRHLLDATGAPPQALEIGVAESTLMDDVEEVIDQLNQLKQTGVTIALDGFGTSNSSFTHLQRLPLDILKIDQSFIKDMEHDEGASSIVYSVITLAHALNKAVVAEGVETVRQVNRLRAWECEQIQGYYYSRPVSASELEEIMNSARPVEPN